MDNYVFIPIIALCCYSFLFMAFMAAKKSKLINSFLLFLMAMILWTGGSLCMRLELWPSFELWYHLSVLGLCLMPFSFFRFITEFIGVKDYFFSRFYLISIGIINLINIITDFFLPPPTVVITEIGRTAFIYDVSWTVVFLFLICGLITFHALFLIFRFSKKKPIAGKQFRPIILGVLTIVIGHMALFIPIFKGFPTDILSGVLFSFFLFYALYKQNLFNLTLLVSRGTCYGLSAALSLLLFSNLVGLFQTFIDNNFSAYRDHSVLIIAVLFAASTSGIYYAMKRFLDKVFTKDELFYAESLKKFSSKISKTLEIKEILTEVQDVLLDAIKVKKVYICILNENNVQFEIVHSTSPLDRRDWSIRNDNPLVKRLQKDEGYLLIKEFKHSIDYKSLWETEKKELDDLGIECLVALTDGPELVGMILLADRVGRKSYSYNEINFLASINSIASIAVSNSRLYEKACREAQTDELTGLLNRKYFYETLKEVFENKKDQSLALVMFNIDDFKLYNQLYGNKEGDVALQRIADIIRASVGENGYAARYNGKEFAAILPQYDLLGAKNLAENIQLQILEMNEKEIRIRLKTLTVSVGISGIPFAASSVKELIDNVERAIYHIKRHGKNAIMIYSERDSIAFRGKATSRTDIRENVYSEYEATIYALTAAIDTKDHYTFNHSNNVAYYAVELAYAFGMSEESAEIIKEAALLHDIGKIGIPEQILNKPGALTEEEYEIMKGHVESSIEIIRHLPSLDYVIPAVMGHHERYDGLGYPRKIAKQDIPLMARILCIVDSFDAMISERSYKKAYSVSSALKIIQEESGRQFDPELAYLFVKSIKDQTIIVKNAVENVS
ncbi:diguanylate cyclase [Eubacteriaceae bacterium ES3]|nr:diguanylate cyclase [Eubacteriaceae bacterium ES3]